MVHYVMVHYVISSVLSDFRWCQTVATTRDRDFSVVLETLQLSQDALESHPSGLNCLFTDWQTSSRYWIIEP